MGDLEWNVKRAKGSGVGRAVWVTGWMAAVGLMMIVAPAMASAVHPTGTKTISAPYKGTVTPSNLWSATGCAKAKIITPGFFRLGTGVGGFSDSAAAKSCASSTSSYAQADGAFFAYLSLPFHKGPTTINATVTYAVTGHTALTGGSCKISGSPSYSYCDRFVEVYAIAYAYFYDLTTGSGYSVGSLQIAYNYSINDTSCSGTICSTSTTGATGPIAASGSASFVYKLSTNMVKTDRYSLELETLGEAYVSMDSSNMVITGALGTASLDLATTGNGFVLTSIVES